MTFARHFIPDFVIEDKSSHLDSDGLWLVIWIDLFELDLVKHLCSTFFALEQVLASMLYLLYQ